MSSLKKIQVSKPLVFEFSPEQGVLYVHFSNDIDVAF